MRPARVLLVFAAATALAGCHATDGIATPPSPPAGAMTYTGYDESGHAVVRGWIWFDLPAAAGPTGTEFGGTWNLHEAAGAPGDPLGPQIGSGTLEGEIRADGTWVSLNPGCADDCVFLFGTLTAGGPAPMAYAGTWEWNTLTGPRASGTFEASQ